MHLGEEGECRRLHLIHWNTICQPRVSDGLGTRRAEDINKSLRVKIIWRMHTEPEKPWVRLLKEKYKFKALQDVHDVPASNASFIWKEICWSRDLFNMG